jgi:hypothetical protein
MIQQTFIGFCFVCESIGLFLYNLKLQMEANK